MQFLSNQQRLFESFTDETGEWRLRVLSVDENGAALNTTPTISVVNVPLGNVETSFALPNNCKGFKLRPRQISRMRISYSSGGTASNYFSVSLGGSYEDLNFYSSRTIYFLTDRNGIDIEILTFT